MTARLKLAHEIYLYAQDLDNLGGTEYWRLTAGGSVRERLLSTDPRLSAVRDHLDELGTSGREWLIGGAELPCRVNSRGDCVLTLRPLTLDVNGRISPVLLLFNALAPGRGQAVKAIEALPALMGRELAQPQLVRAAQLKRSLGWPAVFLCLHIFMFGRRSSSV